MSEFSTKYRTHTCGELRPSHVVRPRAAPERAPLDDVEVALPLTRGGAAAVTLCGHVDARVDDTTVVIRDRYGKTLVAASPGALPYVAERFSKLGLEDVVQVSGEVAPRAKKDPALATGEVFLRVSKIEVLSIAEPPPEGLLHAKAVSFEERLTYRQLYLRRADVKERLAFRAKVGQAIREHLVARRFVELETPQLFWYDKVATNPEPVPVPGGKAFALPNGSVVLDQYINAGGFDRFFQFLRITRRERNWTPLHAQEHTGLDVNMAYVDVPDFLDAMDALLAHVFRATLGVEMKKPLRLSYAEALAKYGTDRVDARFGLELQVLDVATPKGEVARAFLAPALPEGTADSEVDEAVRSAARAGVALAWVRFVEPAPGEAEFGLRGPAAALFRGKPELAKALGAKRGGAAVVASGAGADEVGAAAGAARVALARRLKLFDEKDHAPVWIHSYPYMELDQLGRLVPRVVVFARPAPGHAHMIMNQRRRGQICSRTFDLVLDGIECASGYIGNHSLTEQREIWDLLYQLSPPELVRLRAPIEAHRFGVPPHGGINIGFDRLVARLLGLSEIDEVMFFPKSPDCRDLTLDAPGPVSAAWVADLMTPPPAPPKFTENDLAEEVLKA
jgi:aspartyl-tRNA synthetase